MSLAPEVRHRHRAASFRDIAHHDSAPLQTTAPDLTNRRLMVRAENRFVIVRKVQILAALDRDSCVI